MTKIISRMTVQQQIHQLFKRTAQRLSSLSLLSLRDLSFVPAAFSAVKFNPSPLRRLGWNRFVSNKNQSHELADTDQSPSPAHGCHSLLAGHILLVVVHALSQLQETVRKVFVDVFTPHICICGVLWHHQREECCETRHIVLSVWFSKYFCWLCTPCISLICLVLIQQYMHFKWFPYTGVNF